MVNFRGEFESKIDAKGRFLLPAGIRKKVPAEAKDCFVINRGFEGCLNLFPLNEWEAIEEELKDLDMYVKRNREFMRLFTNGVADLELDASGRLLIPKRLLSWASIEKEIVLMSQFNRIEIWDKKRHGKLLDVNSEEYSDLGEVMARKTSSATAKNSNSGNDSDLS